MWKIGVGFALFAALALYILSNGGDISRALDLLLLGGVTGKETDGHDWNNVLTMLGWLEYDHRLAPPTTSALS